MYDPQKPYKKQILELIKKTFKTPYLSVKENAYPIYEKKFSYPEVDHTDGLGTKGIYHWQKRTLKYATLDALAMNLNDLALVRARPYKLQNHILIPKDDKEAILEIIETLTEESKKREIAICGGETSIHNNLEGLEISLTVSGFIKKPRPNKFGIGDVLVGLKSNGLHSNGFSKVREVFGHEYRPDFVVPTKIYLDTLLPLDEQFDIHGMAHITGGAYTKLKDFLGDADVIIKRNHKLEPQPIFKELYKRGISDEEMYSTFNCGIGFILAVASDEADKIVSHLRGDIIGEVMAGIGKVKIESLFSNKEIEF